LWPKTDSIEHDLFRRAAAALTSLDAALTGDDQLPKRGLIEQLRPMFPGSPFKPTEAFVRKLKTKHPDDPYHKEWSISCLLGAMGCQNRTMVTVMDTSPSSAWTDQIVGQQILYGEDETAHHKPTDRELYDVLLEGMAGAGSETRATAGPPRRPEVVVVSYRLREAFKELKKFLARVDVDCVLESEETLRFITANHHTDFETGGIPKEDQTLVGRRVGLCELVNRSDLNGRVGRIIRWHEDQGRWEVKLESLCRGEESIKIGIRPINLTQCPAKFHNTEDYVLYKEAVKGWSGDGAQKTSRTNDADVEKLLDKLRAHQSPTSSPDTICAICQDNADNSKEISIACLPCGHTFHLYCVLPWIKLEKTECPCCRSHF
jgi:hypothetical protein